MNRAAVVSLLLIHIATRLIERTSSVNYSAPKYRQPMQRLISSELLICRSEFADISSGLVLCVKWKLQSKADSMSLLALIGMKREFWWRRITFRLKRESQRIISIKGRWMTSSSCDHQLLSHWLLRFQLRHLTLLVCSQPCGSCWELHCFSLRFSIVGAAYDAELLILTSPRVKGRAELQGFWVEAKLQSGISSENSSQPWHQFSFEFSPMTTRLRAKRWRAITSSWRRSACHCQEERFSSLFLTRQTNHE